MLKAKAFGAIITKEDFYGDAIVDAVCDAIQKRVQLILDENR